MLPRPRLVLALALVALVATACGTRSDRLGRPASSSTASSTGTSRPAPTSTSSPAPTTSPGATPSEGCTPARAAPAGVSEHTLDVGGEARTYLVDVPPGYDGTRPVPLVMTFHGLASGAREQLAYSGFGALGEQQGFVTVAPQGRGLPAAWDFFSPASSPTSDLAFVHALLDQVGRDLCIDPRRRYADGISNGSALTFSLACSGTSGFAAYGGVAGAFHLPLCGAAGPTPIIYFHGTADPIVPIEGGDGLGAAMGGARQTMQQWADQDGCRADPDRSTPADTVTLLAWTDCRDGSAVRYYVIDGGGHTWPGASPLPNPLLGATTDRIDATRLMWDFFQAHPAR